MSQRSLGADTIVHGPPAAAPSAIGPPPHNGGARAPGETAASAAECRVLAGRRILLVEDEFFIAMLVRDLLQELGCDVIGPLSNLSRSLEAATREVFDAAVLDVNLGGEMSYPVAEELGRRGIPFLFTTGYSAAQLPAQFRSVPCLPKPIEPGSLKAVLIGLLP